MGLGLGAMTEVSLAPRVQYFVTKNIYAMLNADMLSVAGEDVTLGLNSLNIGVENILYLESQIPCVFPKGIFQACIG